MKRPADDGDAQGCGMCGRDVAAASCDTSVITSCGHNFCTGCLAGHVITSLPELARCPLCNNLVAAYTRSFPADGVESRDTAEVVLGTEQEQRAVRMPGPLALVLSGPAGDAVAIAIAGPRAAGQGGVEPALACATLREGEEHSTQARGVLLWLSTFLHSLVILPETRSGSTETARGVGTQAQLLAAATADDTLLGAMMRALCNGTLAPRVDTVDITSPSRERARVLVPFVCAELLRRHLDRDTYRGALAMFLAKQFFCHRVPAALKKLLTVLFGAATSRPVSAEGGGALNADALIGQLMMEKTLALISFDNFGYLVRGKFATFDEWMHLRVEEIRRTVLDEIAARLGAGACSCSVPEAVPAAVPAVVPAVAPQYEATADDYALIELAHLSRIAGAMELVMDGTLSFNEAGSALAVRPCAGTPSKAYVAALATEKFSVSDLSQQDCPSGTAHVRANGEDSRVDGGRGSIHGAHRGRHQGVITMEPLHCSLAEWDTVKAIFTMVVEMHLKRPCLIAPLMCQSCRYPSVMGCDGQPAIKLEKMLDPYSGARACAWAARAAVAAAADACSAANLAVQAAMEVSLAYLHDREASTPAAAAAGAAAAAAAAAAADDDGETNPTKLLQNWRALDQTARTERTKLLGHLLPHHDLGPIGCDTTPLCGPDVGDGVPVAIHVEKGGMHLLQKARHQIADLFWHSHLQLFVKQFRPTLGRQDWYRKSGDQRIPAQETPSYAVAHCAVAFEALRSAAAPGDEISDLDVREHMLKRAVMFPILCIIMLELQLYEAAAVLERAERRGGAREARSAERVLASLLFTVTQAVGYVFLCARSCERWAAAAPAVRAMIDEICFARPTRGWRAHYRMDTTVENDIGEIRDPTGHEHVPGMEPLVRASVLNLAEISEVRAEEHRASGRPSSRSHRINEAAAVGTARVLLHTRAWSVQPNGGEFIVITKGTTVMPGEWIGLEGQSLPPCLASAAHIGESRWAKYCCRRQEAAANGSIAPTELSSGDGLLKNIPRTAAEHADHVSFAEQRAAARTEVELMSTWTGTCANEGGTAKVKRSVWSEKEMRTEVMRRLACASADTDFEGLRLRGVPRSRASNAKHLASLIANNHGEAPVSTTDTTQKVDLAHVVSHPIFQHKRTDPLCTVTVPEAMVGDEGDGDGSGCSTIEIPFAVFEDLDGLQNLEELLGEAVMNDENGEGSAQ